MAYEYHGPAATQLGSRSKKRAEFDALVEKLRDGDDRPLLDALRAKRFKSTAFLAMIVELTLEQVADNPRRSLALADAVMPVIEDKKISCLIVRVLAAKGLAAVNIGDLGFARVALEEGFKRSRCEYCVGELTRHNAVRLASAGQFEDARREIGVALDIYIRHADECGIGKALYCRGTIIHLGADAGLEWSRADAMTDLRTAVRRLQSAEAPERFSAAAIQALVRFLTISGKRADRTEALQLLPMVKKMLSLRGARAAMLKYTYGLLLAAEKKKRASRRLMTSALQELEQLGMLFEVAAVKADLAALDYPNRKKILELFKDWESAPADLRKILEPFWRTLADKSVLLLDSDPDGDLAQALRKLRAALAEAVDIPPCLIELPEPKGRPLAPPTPTGF